MSCLALLGLSTAALSPASLVHSGHWTRRSWPEVTGGWRLGWPHNRSEWPGHVWLPQPVILHDVSTEHGYTKWEFYFLQHEHLKNKCVKQNYKLKSILDCINYIYLYILRCQTYHLYSVFYSDPGLTLFQEIDHIHPSHNSCKSFEIKSLTFFMLFIFFFTLLAITA